MVDCLGRNFPEKCRSEGCEIGFPALDPNRSNFSVYYVCEKCCSEVCLKMYFFFSNKCFCNVLHGEIENVRNLQCNTYWSFKVSQLADTCVEFVFYISQYRKNFNHLYMHFKAEFFRYSWKPRNPHILERKEQKKNNDRRVEYWTRSLPNSFVTFYLINMILRSEFCTDYEFWIKKINQ